MSEMRHDGRGRASRRAGEPDDAVEAAFLAARARRRRVRPPRGRVLVLLLVLLAVLVVAASLGAGFVAAGGRTTRSRARCPLREQDADLARAEFVRLLRDRRPARCDRLQPAPAAARPRPDLHVAASATVAIEDRRFYHHGGLDYVGIVRAAIADASADRAGARPQPLPRPGQAGALVEAEAGVPRGPHIARSWSRRKILDTYLNQVAYGAAAAAHTYFGTSAARLTLAEAALLAGLPQAPSAYDPFVHPALAGERRTRVLRAMHSAGYISKRRYCRPRAGRSACIPARSTSRSTIPASSATSSSSSPASAGAPSSRAG